jgi:hypothetical protein
MSIQLSDGHYRVIAPHFVCGVHILNGRIETYETAPILRRLGGMMADTFACYARSKKWKVNAVKEGEVAK